MFRDILLWISETLFYLTGGEMLLNTPWFFPWIVFGIIFMLSPLFIYLKNAEKYKYFGFLTVFTFFSGLLIVISPGAIQGQLMTECRDNTASLQIFVDDVLSETDEITITQCRYKNNYYGEFGEWELK
jgi:hypothetical protein